MVQSQSSNDLGAQVCRNITVSGRRTSIRMEVVFWSELQRISEMEKQPLNDLITMIDGRKGTSNLTAAIRVFVVCYIRAMRGETNPPTGAGTGEPSDESGPGEDSDEEDNDPSRQAAGSHFPPVGPASA